MNDVSHNVVEEESVVWYDETRNLHLRLQVVGQPGNGCVIQMICRLCFCSKEKYKDISQ